MDRHRGIGGGSGDRYSGGPPDSRQYRSTRVPPRPILNDSYAINPRQNRSSPPANYYNQGFSGGGHDRASLDSPPRFLTSGGGNGRGAGFHPNGSGGGGAVNLDYQMMVINDSKMFRMLIDNHRHCFSESLLWNQIWNKLHGREECQLIRISLPFAQDVFDGLFKRKN